MVKRIVTRIGDIFCVEIEGKYKCYFQFIDKDVNLLNSDVIRAFKTRYSMDYKPIVKDIISGETLFCSHVFIRAGLMCGAWYKIDMPKCKEYNKNHDVIYGTVSPDKQIIKNNEMHLITVNQFQNWTIWKPNEITKNRTELTEDEVDRLELGTVKGYSQILFRFKYGYFSSWANEYDIIKRRPIAGVNSYTKHEIDGNECYFHYIGEDIYREMIVTPQGVIKLTKEEPEKDGYTFHTRKFWEINWAFKDHITEDDFLSAYNSD